MSTKSLWRKKPSKPSKAAIDRALNQLPLFADLPPGPNMKVLTFAMHQPGCWQCFKYDPKKTATLAYLCDIGEKLLKKGYAMLEPKRKRRTTVSVVERQERTAYCK